MICPVEPLKRQYNLALRNFQTVAIYRGGFFIYKYPWSQVQGNEKMVSHPNCQKMQS
jgi:hypothetical protein